MLGLKRKRKTGTWEYCCTAHQKEKRLTEKKRRVSLRTADRKEHQKDLG